MPSELQQAARTAWGALTDSARPMPPGIALDMVQEHTGGDRNAAVTAIVREGASWLDAQTRPDVGSAVCDLVRTDARLVTGYIRHEAFALAALRLGEMRATLASGGLFGPHPNDLVTTSRWLRWADKAAVALYHCQAVADAAHPKTESVS